MKELIIEFGNDTLGEVRIYQRNLKGYEQAIKDMKLYKAQQKAEIDYLKSQITAECKEHQETMRLADKTIKRLELALELACYKLTDFESSEKESVHSSQYWFDYLKQRAEEIMKSE